MFLPKKKLDVFFPARKAVDACREVVAGGMRFSFIAFREFFGTTAPVVTTLWKLLT
jgi:hypothetical protein